MIRAQLADPPAVFMRENTPYYLASWELSEEELPGRMQYGESSVVYEKVGMNAEIPETAEISMEGENGLFTVPLVRSEYGNQRWEDDFSFTLTFHSCQADTYELGGIEISSDPDSDRPELQGYESELLEMLGLPEAHYRITDYAWREKPIRTKEEHCAGTRVQRRTAGERLPGSLRRRGGSVSEKGLEDEGSVPPERRGRAEAASFRAGSEKKRRRAE